MFQVSLKQSLVLVLLVVIPLYLSVRKPVRPKETTSFSSSDSEESTITTNAFGVKVEKNPTQSKLTELGVTTWPKWGCSPSKFPWSFTATETMYLLKGKVNVQVEGHEGTFSIGAGDLVVFPKGFLGILNCIWLGTTDKSSYVKETTRTNA